MPKIQCKKIQKFPKFKIFHVRDVPLERQNMTVLRQIFYN